MNPRTSHRTAAFTLIELLTVIAIIAILMGLLFPVLGAAKNQARKAAASTAVRNIVSACKSYQADYGKYPPVAAALVQGKNYYAFGDTTAGGCQAGNEQLFDSLRSINRGANTNYVMNTRQVKYFEMTKAKDTKNPRDGFVDGSDFAAATKAVQGQLMDPWGAQYCIVLDANGEGPLDMSSFYSDLSSTTNQIRQSAVAFSMGIDSKRGGKGYEGQLRKGGSTDIDDIVSWQ